MNHHNIAERAASQTSFAPSSINKKIHQRTKAKHHLRV